MFNPLPATYIKDTDGFPPPIPGVCMVKFGTVTYQTTAGTGLFFLPNNAEIVSWEFVVNTTFNAGTTNTLDVGVSGAQTQFASAVALTAANTIIFNGFVNSQTLTKLAGVTTVTVRYNQTGTAATTGSGVLVCYYIVR